jgi:hypothetical protein
VPQTTRDQVVDTVDTWAEKSGIGSGRMIAWLKISPSKFYDWKHRYGDKNRHNAPIPRKYWPAERE